jgi:hypothetical protein
MLIDHSDFISASLQWAKVEAAELSGGSVGQGREKRASSASRGAVHIARLMHGKSSAPLAVRSEA